MPETRFLPHMNFYCDRCFRQSGYEKEIASIPLVPSWLVQVHIDTIISQAMRLGYELLYPTPSFPAYGRIPSHWVSDRQLPLRTSAGDLATRVQPPPHFRCVAPKEASGNPSPSSMQNIIHPVTPPSFYSMTRESLPHIKIRMQVRERGTEALPQVWMRGGFVRGAVKALLCIFD